MIKISSWKSYRANELSRTSLNSSYNATFTFIDQYDDRSSWSSKYIDSVSEDIITLDYCHAETALVISGEKFNLFDLQKYDIPEGKILVDSTSLALPELMHLFSILNNKKKSFDVMYVQPNNYTMSKPQGLKATQSFDLSDDGEGIQQLQPYVNFSNNTVIFYFLGWEGHRLGGLINSEEYFSRNITCLVGIPPFKTSWDYKILSSNYSQLSELSNITTPRFKYAGANDPIKTYEIIEQVYKSACYSQQSLSLAPLGTKPATIAAAQFAVNNPRLIMLYDFVKKKIKRSSGADIVHIWSFDYED
ncbi:MULTISPECIES: hypothetical protein [unclassified Methylophaga]|jgi:hypothetical protein|uniref:hypothetical protein n=1 Tax=unclassified Methylophaga TaxID=2629249 RepID=UPI00259D1244|nr:MULTISPECIES: hypothetical protein [unclassified Methylophaga]|tara:strand:+ start:7103 stop:8014 length:912 start_codon:yes stop_codon:yes gene_type:complete